MAWTYKVVNGDIVRNYTNTQYEKVSGKDKMRQDTRMVLTSEVRSNGIGAGLSRFVGSTGDYDNITATVPLIFDFQLAVRGALSRYEFITKNVLRNRRTSAEILEEFTPVQMVQDPADPRKFQWKVQLYTADSRFGFSVGGVYG
jgi:hypothetical protein